MMNRCKSNKFRNNTVNPGGGIFRGGGFHRGRDQFICYNCGAPRHFSRDCTNPISTCSYCKSLDHTVKEFPQLISKWQDKTMGTHNPPQNANKNI